MSQNSNRKRKELQKKKKKTQSAPAKKVTGDSAGSIPSAQTLFRSFQLDTSSGELLTRLTAAALPSALARDAEKIRRIESASGLAELLDLTSVANGLAEHAWHKRIRSFGPDAAPVVALWFRSYAADRPDTIESGVEERCIAALRWCGDAGVDALAASWDAFNDYGRSLTCVVWGLMKAHRMADTIWEYYRTIDQKVKNNFVGALWGLIDLEDPRAADAIYDLMTNYGAFHELFGFIARAGNLRFIIPLLYLCIKCSKSTREDALWAATCIGYRFGKEAVIEHLNREWPQDDATPQSNAAIVDKIFAYSEDEAKNYFSLFYSESMLPFAEKLKPLRLNG